jgi:hypothetical protein
MHAHHDDDDDDDDDVVVVLLFLVVASMKTMSIPSFIDLSIDNNPLDLCKKSMIITSPSLH